MRQQTRPLKEPAEKVVQDIRRATRKHYSAEEKIRIVLEGLRGEDSIAELCRREGIAQNLYYRWSKDFLEAGKKRLAGDTARAATSDDVNDLRREAMALKEVVADLTLENRVLKKSVTGDGEDGERDIRPQRSWRSSGSSSNPICRFGGRWSRSESQDPRFIDGAIFIRLEGQRRWTIAALGLITSPAFIVMKAADEFKDKTTAPNQLWQTDFTYLKVTGWGWFYLSTVLDDFSRYIVAWKLCTTMKAEDVTDTLDLALAASGCDQARIVHKPRLLSDNGSSYVSSDLAEWLDAQNMGHVRGAPYHPQTQGKIERWHQTLKNRILLENYYLPGDLEANIEKFVDHYNHRRYHKSLSNLTPANVYFGRGPTILLERERIKRNTIQKRRLQHQKKAA